MLTYMIMLTMLMWRQKLYNKEDWEAGLQANLHFLDSLDFDFYLNKSSYQDVDDIYDDIDHMYYNTDILPRILHGEPFNYISREEFVDYLRNRYNLNIQEEISIKYVIVGRK